MKSRVFHQDKAIYRWLAQRDYAEIRKRSQLPKLVKSGTGKKPKEGL